MVAHEWMKDQKLISRACHGQIALLDGKTLKRRNVVENADAIAPLIAFFGLRPTVDQIEEQVSLFFEMARPKGKPRATRTLVAYIHACIYTSLGLLYHGIVYRIS